MNKIEVQIHNEKDHSWCEVFGKFIYGKNAEEVSAALDILYMNEPDFFNGNRN